MPAETTCIPDLAKPRSGPGHQGTRGAHAGRRSAAPAEPRSGRRERPRHLVTASLLFAVLATLAGPLSRASAGDATGDGPQAPAPAVDAPAPVPPGGAGAELSDVLVLGSQPEAIAAAVSAAERGARTVLITSDTRMGGLFVLGELNVLDLRTEPEPYQRGLFLRWWRRVGERPAFDVAAAERAFEAMLTQAGVEVIRGAPPAVPLLDANGRLLGARAGDRTVLAKQVIEGERDGRFAAAAGAPYTVGWASLGVHQHMAASLVFALRGVDWSELAREVRARGGEYANVRDNVVWGPFGGYPAAYRPTRSGLRLRGLNLGRESDGTVLVNALLVYGADPFDADSLAEAHARAAAEVPDIVRYLSAGIPGFADARLAGVAPHLYVRETRHLQAQCVLTANEVLDNDVTPWDVAAGGYPLDVQSLTPNDTGFVFGAPDIYGARLCMAVAPRPAPLWVVGMTAGFDPIAFASARVVPFGMALGEAVGVAAARAARLGLDPAALAADRDQVNAVRATLQARGAYLPSVAPRPPVGPAASPYFDAYRVLLGKGLAVGGYDNDPHLDRTESQQSFVYLLSNVATRFFSERDAGPTLVARYGVSPRPLSPAVALGIAYDAACLVGACPAEPTWAALQSAGVAPPGFAPDAPLDRGQAYALAAGVARLADAGP